MEQEPESQLLYSTVKRAGYRLRLAIHLLFLLVSSFGAVILLTALLFGGELTPSQV